MRKLIAVLAGCLAFSGLAWAQTTSDVVDQVKDHVVSIDANFVTYGGVLGTVGQFSRTSQLLTNRLTGFVYTADGFIVTDSRGISDATLLSVAFADGSELEGEVIHVDSDYGIGIIKVDPDPDKPLNPVDIVSQRYDADAGYTPYDQGEPVLAIGYSGGLGGTVTKGIISGVRNFRNRSGILVPSMIQTDTVINSGNEGCALFNLDGEVIAMHEFRSAGMQNTAYFTPSWLICRVADEIIAQHKDPKTVDFEVWRPWLGLKPYAGSVSPISGRIRQVDPALKMYMDIPDQFWQAGILLDSVWFESPAREFGLLDRDMLLTIEVVGDREDPNTGEMLEEQVLIPETLLDSIAFLEMLVTTAERGDIFIFGILRNNSYFKIEVKVGQHPGSFTFVSPNNIAIENSSEYF